MPSIKKMKKTTIGKKAQFNTNTTNPTATKGGGPRGFSMSNPSTVTQGAGRKGAGGKAMGTRKGGGGRSY